jgi:hypothetical protein
VSDRWVILPNMSFGQRYQQTTSRLRNVTRRSSWPAAVLSDVRDTPSSNFPGSPTDAELPGWPSSSFNLAIPAVSLTLPQGRWVVTASVTQDVSPVVDVFSVLMTMALAVDDVIVGDILVQESLGRIVRTMRKSISLVSGGAMVVKALSGYGYIDDGGPSPATLQNIETAVMVAYPG